MDIALWCINLIDCENCTARVVFLSCCFFWCVFFLFFNFIEKEKKMGHLSLKSFFKALFAATLKSTKKRSAASCPGIPDVTQLKSIDAG